MFRTALLAAALLGTSMPVFAQDATDYSGTYLGSGEGDLTLELNHIEDDAYGISIETVVPMENDMPGCAGGIEGEVLLSEGGGNFFVENEMYDPESDSPMFSERYCEVGLTFNEDGTVVMEERDGCLEYHGASCGFSGNLVHENAAG
ncbi:hypothetical protein DevBK_05285 [Devosia sp. BK]|uniref:hypothetical protein n=1 Tax=Devosia sp. BK TaxID=2871706 RepID=UPI00293AF7CD|nr:hypothetical protein [Devosia sp. BK]MDV3250743.1 hypothetical protein [Devosia sp. BK]